MSQTSASVWIERDGQPADALTQANPLCALVYRSRAVQPLSGTELNWLTQVAQARNRAASITGVFVYDGECFYQWLEGPRDSLSQVMESIRSDRRHTDIEILDHRQTTARQFGGWAMKLATHGRHAAPRGLDSIEAPAELLTDLHLHPDYAPALLIRLSPGSNHAPSAGLPTVRGGSLDGGAVLQDVIRSAVIPQLLSAYQPLPMRHGHARIAQLAELLIGAEAQPAIDLLMRLRAHVASTGALVSSMVEPAARALGDLWLDDACSEFDVSIGLSRLQTALRQMGHAVSPLYAGNAPPPAVLVVPEPGERHLLGAALDSDVLWSAGWAPQSEFPASDAALQDLVDDHWFDALDLSLSTAMRREHWLPRVAQTIAKARRASRNPGLVIIVGGRVFAELDDARAAVGADAGSRSAQHIEALILRGLALAH
jgi:hypothetical protein